jgi:geranylgeranyl pyrophosphate synthase
MLREKAPPSTGTYAAEARHEERFDRTAVAAGELFHTASLMFDDLAQDNAKVGEAPTAHTVFGRRVQLAAVSMISSGFGLLAQLDRLYPAHKVTEVIAYIGTVLGPKGLCRGQDLDLHLAKGSVPITGEDILEMYDLKTSSSLEAALVPLMMREQTAVEIDLVKNMHAMPESSSRFAMISSISRHQPTSLEKTRRMTWVR